MRINAQEMHYCAFHPQGLGHTTLAKVVDSVFSLSIVHLSKQKLEANTQAKKILFWEYARALLENVETVFIILPLVKPNTLITTRPTSCSGLRKSHKNI